MRISRNNVSMKQISIALGNCKRNERACRLVIKAIFHQPWRSGWLGQLLGCHSRVEEQYGRCWCQKKFAGFPHLQGAKALLIPANEDNVEVGDDITRKLIVIPLAEDSTSYIPKEPKSK